MNATIRYLGRRSGLPHTLVVDPEPAGEAFMIRVDDPATTRWWRNFWTPWPLTLVDRDHLVHCSGEVVREEAGPAAPPAVLVRVCPCR
ncbi:MAG TPA: hypothetical protein VET65_08010 [Candidatus Limnocylindrales bacterium]|nr:hypothetical protein [Candidatus Limnocylindrales bacterium]